MADAPDAVRACPDCDSVDIRYRPNRGTGPRPVGERPDAGDWCCPHCGAVFERPAERPRRAAGGRPPSGWGDSV